MKIWGVKKLNAGRVKTERQNSVFFIAGASPVACKPAQKLGVVAFTALMAVLFMGCNKEPVWAAEFTDEQIVNAIYLAEGGDKAQYAYGIRSVHYDTVAEARRICFNTVRNNRKRFAKQTKYTDYLEFLASRYCPVSAHPLNKNWLKNVHHFLGRVK